jgi:hypothetical protein
MADWVSELRRHAGTRPYGFWIFDVGLGHRPDFDEQITYLREHGLLTLEEKTELARRDALRRATLH